MKQGIFFIAFLLILKLQGESKTCELRISHPWFSESDTTRNEDLLLKLKFKKYLNEPVSKLLSDIEPKYTYVNFVEMKPYYLAFVSFKYGENLWLDVYIPKYIYVKQLLTEKEYDVKDSFWNLDNFRNEKIGKIRLRKNGKVLTECPKEPELPLW